MMQTECLLAGRADAATLHVKVRFLHTLEREVCKFTEAVSTLAEDDVLPLHETVSQFNTGGKLYQPWLEVIERDVDAGLLPVSQISGTPSKTLFSFPASCTRELIRNEDGRIAGALLRRQEAVEGAVEIVAIPVDSQVFKISTRIFNYTPLAEDALEIQEAVVMRTFTSTHTILNVQGGEFISLIDPPADRAQAVAACRSTGTWPVLVGDEKKGERDTLLSSPIILYDYPQIAPESPGDLYDGCEIDEILTLRIMTMTDEEKLEMRHVDDYARRILERTENLPGEDFMKMHGVMRDVQHYGEDFFNPDTKRKTVNVAGVDLKAGDQVRIHPRGRADAMDIALRGRLATIEAIEEDAEGQIHFALVIDDDPGRDLGMLRQPGHRFFYRQDEVEPVEAVKS